MLFKTIVFAVITALLGGSGYAAYKYFNNNYVILSNQELEQGVQQLMLLAYMKGADSCKNSL